MDDVHGPVGPIVPDGVVWVVRDMDINGVTDTVGDVLAVASPTLGNLFIVRILTGGSGDNKQWRGRQVFNTGEWLKVTSFQGTWDVTISGYALTLP